MADKLDLIEDYLKTGSSVINLPYRYRASADPGGRVFVRHMMMDAPLISMRPGRPVFRGQKELAAAFRTLLGVSSNAEAEKILASGVEAIEGIFSDRQFGEGQDLGHYESLKKEVQRKRWGAPAVDNILKEGIRYIEFDQAISEYISTVLTLTSRVHASLSQGSAEIPFTPGQAREAVNKSTRGGFFTFWAENSTSVSESANSEYSASFLEGLMEKPGNIVREAQQFIGLTGPGGMLEAAASRSLDIASEVISGEQYNGVRTSLASGIKGYKPSFPQMWKGSSFSRSYNLSFKLYSPYGSPEAIFRNVYIPFIMLLAMALPMSRSPGSFSAPFMFQVDSPGFFACDLGICTSLTFTKGGSEGLWSADGLPRMIDVTMAVDDLYPALTASHNVGSLKVNIGLMTFLDNLSGINLSLSGERQSVYGSIRERINQASTFGAPTKEAVIGFTQDFYYDFSARRILGNLFGASETSS